MGGHVRSRAEVMAIFLSLVSAHDHWFIQMMQAFCLP
jgi:hypothetical protein